MNRCFEALLLLLAQFELTQALRACGCIEPPRTGTRSYHSFDSGSFRELTTTTYKYNSGGQYPTAVVSALGSTLHAGFGHGVDELGNKLFEESSTTRRAARFTRAIAFIA